MNILLPVYPGDAWGLLIIGVLVQVTVVILTALLLTRLGNRWNAAWRHSIYCAALVCVLASPMLSWAMQATGFTLIRLHPMVPTARAVEPINIPMVPIMESSPIEIPAALQTTTDRAPLESQGAGQSLPPKMQALLSGLDMLRGFAVGAVVIWFSGMVLLMARWCYGLHLIALLRRTARPLECEGMTQLLCHVRHALGTDQLPPMAASDSLDRPVMVGLIRPLVILPEDMLRTLHGAELADILVHECAHAVCRHQLVSFLQRLAGMLFWPHPLVHLLNRELARAREEVCDNYVLRQSNAPRYARTLLELSQSFVGMSPNPTALGLFHCRWRLEDRVADLLDRRRMVMIRVNRWTAAALTATFLLLALLIAGVRVAQAEPVAEAKAAPSAVSSGSPSQPPPAVANPGAELPKPVAGRNFVIVPFTTELQRADRWNYGAARLFILINGKALFKDDNAVLDAGALDYEGLSKALQPFGVAETKNGCIAQVVCPQFPSNSMYMSASSAFLGFLDNQGWHTDTDNKGNVEMVHFSRELDWTSVVAALSKPATAEDIRLEAGVGDDLVKAYPICTPLSFHLLGGDGENCVIRNMKPLDEFTPEEVQAFPERAKAYIGKLELKQAPRVRFLTHYGKSVAKANEVDGQLHRENDAWWKSQGFVVCGGTMWEGGRPTTPTANKSESQTPALSAAEKEERERTLRKTWQLGIVLDVPDLSPQAVQYTILDKDPVPAFAAQVNQVQPYYRRELEKADSEVKKEQTRNSQMTVSWNFGFREITADKLHLLTKRPNPDMDAPGMVSNSPEGKKWIVTKVVSLNNKPVCWCIPVDVKIGNKVEITLNESNAFDLHTAYDDAMKQPQAASRKGTWQIAFELDVPNWTSPVLQYSVFDEDPVPAFVTRVQKAAKRHQEQLGNEDSDAKKELVRSIQANVDWDLGFKEITGDKLYLITDRSNSSMMSNAPAGKKWIVTKTADMQGKSVCWCIPIEVKTGELVTVSFGEKNVFDLRSVYDKAMRESEGSVAAPAAE